MLYFKLFYEFFKTGLFAIGGGLATLPFLYEISGKTGWFTTQDISNMIAISESTPGPIGINMSTFVGFQTAGFLGGIVATMALIIPSIIIIEFISTILTKFKESKIIQYIFYGIRPASTALIAVAGFALIRTTIFDAPTDYGINYVALIACVLLFLAIRKFKLHPLIYIAAAAVSGIFLDY